MVRSKKGARPASSDEVRKDASHFRLIFPYGFIDDDGMHRFWHADQQVLDDEELELLRARGVNLKED